MRKYYTRACNFYHGSEAIKLIKNKNALPLNGKNNIAFDSIEIFSRQNKGIKVNLININKINKLSKKVKEVVKNDLKKIISKRKNFLKNINFDNTSIMGILNLTPDSFSDGGKFNSNKKANKQIVLYFFLKLFRTYLILSHSIFGSIVFEPGRVDSPPTSMIFAPDFIMLEICLNALLKLLNFPPSEKLSGVRLRIPIIDGD